MFDQWAILELMGHVRMAGRVTEEERFGSKLGRVDVPDGDGFTTVYFGGSSVYRMTPTTEAIARGVASRNKPEPVHRWELPAPEKATAIMDGEPPPGRPYGSDYYDDDGTRYETTIRDDEEDDDMDFGGDDDEEDPDDHQPILHHPLPTVELGPIAGYADTPDVQPMQPLPRRQPKYELDADDNEPF